MKPEKGCVLLAHPVMFANSQTYFHQAVIFIIEHSETEGTYGERCWRAVINCVGPAQRFVLLKSDGKQPTHVISSK